MDTIGILPDNVAVSFLWQLCYFPTEPHYPIGTVTTSDPYVSVKTVDFQGRHLSRMSLSLSICLSGVCLESKYRVAKEIPRYTLGILKIFSTCFNLWCWSYQRLTYSGTIQYGSQTKLFLWQVYTLNKTELGCLFWPNLGSQSVRFVRVRSET